MGLNRILQGLVWAWRVGRINRRHHVILSLVSGATFFFFLLVLNPHPAPPLTHHGVPHGAARRIQQEADDYTGPKNIKRNVQEDNRIPESGREAQVDGQAPQDTFKDTGRGEVELVTQETPTSHGGVILTNQHFPTFHHNDAPPPLLHGISHTARDVGGGGAWPPLGHNNPEDNKEALSQLAYDIPKTAKERQQVMSAQERALEAQQHGYRLTQNQKNLLDRLSPSAKAALEQKNTKMRDRQTQAYLDHLRARRQIVPREGGGEEIFSSPLALIRFPLSLTLATKETWTKSLYAVFANVTHHPWVKTEQCQNYTITFYPPASHQTQAIASFPSSGNTWIRYLIECATGVFTGSFYDDNSLIRKGYYGEGIPYNSGMTVLQKTHGFTTGESMTLPYSQQIEKNHMKEMNNRGVIVIRNPFKALISHRNLDVGGHTGFAPKAHFLGTGWAEFVTIKIQLWRNFYIAWTSLTDPHNIHVTHYEHVKDNPVGEMWKILNFLDIQPDPERLQCLAKNTDGLFKRKPSKNVPLDFNPFTDELKALIYKAIEEVNEALAAAGKDILPLDKYEIYDANEAKEAMARRQQSTGVRGAPL